MFQQPSQGDHIEQKVRKINRLATEAGFGPLNVREIEEILAKVTPVRAINGQPDQLPRQQPPSAMAGPMQPPAAPGAMAGLMPPMQGGLA